jgi:hypothetical protein
MEAPVMKPPRVRFTVWRLMVAVAVAAAAVTAARWVGGREFYEPTGVTTLNGGVAHKIAVKRTYADWLLGNRPQPRVPARPRP